MKMGEKPWTSAIDHKHNASAGANFIPIAFMWDDECAGEKQFLFTPVWVGVSSIWIWPFCANERTTFHKSTDLVGSPFTSQQILYNENGFRVPKWPTKSVERWQHVDSTMEQLQFSKARFGDWFAFLDSISAIRQLFGGQCFTVWRADSSSRSAWECVFVRFKREPRNPASSCRAGRHKYTIREFVRCYNCT